MIQASELTEYGYYVYDGEIHIVSWGEHVPSGVLERANYKWLADNFESEIRTSYDRWNSTAYLRADDYISEELFNILKGMHDDGLVLDESVLWDVEREIREDVWYWLWTDMRGGVEAELYGEALHDDEFGDLESVAVEVLDDLLMNGTIEFVAESSTDGYYTDTHLIVERTVERVIADHRAPFVIDGQLELL
jgi:hypothetical protein